MKELRLRILKRYQLYSATPANAIWHFFNLGNDPYSSAISEMLKNSPQHALRQDLLSVVDDFNKVYQKESKLVDVEQE